MAAATYYQSRRHLPSDLLPDILSRLPVKSLLRFRCVSKPWLSLIDDAGFARLHLKSFKNNSDETHLFVAYDSHDGECIVRCSDTFEATSQTLFSLQNNGDRKWFIVSSVDGLVLLQALEIGQFRHLKVWNPSIRKFREIPSLLPQLDISFSPCYVRDVNISLGYDPLSNDYKIVKLIFVKRHTLDSVAIYSLGVGSWRIIKFQGKGSSSTWPISASRGVYCKGSLYFFSANKYSVCNLAAFNLSNDFFSFISMPSDDYDYEYDGCASLVLVDDGSSLAMFYGDNLWVLDSKNESLCWTKRYSVELNFPYPDNKFLYRKKNGDILIIRDETGEKKMVRWQEVVSFNPNINESKILQQWKGYPYYILIDHVSCYIESLILHK